MTAFGGDVRIHLPQKRWDFSAAPGLAVINIDADSAAMDDTTTLGPSLFLTVAYQINANVSLGLENQ